MHNVYMGHNVYCTARVGHGLGIAQSAEFRLHHIYLWEDC